MEDWDKGSMEYKCPHFGESVYWMLDGLNHGQWQRRYINGNPWLEYFLWANTGLPSSVTRHRILGYMLMCFLGTVLSNAHWIIN